METNRRQYPRQSNKIPIQVLFASDSPRDDLDRNSGMSAKICNQSHNGLYIETDRALESGSTIRVKMIPPENVIRTKISVEDAMKMVVSAGMVSPHVIDLVNVDQEAHSNNTMT